MGRERRDRVAAVAAAAASASMLWAASPSNGAGWVAWVALVPAAAVALRLEGRLGRLVLPLTYGLYLELLLVPALPLGLAEDQWADDPLIPIMVADSPVVFAGVVAVPLVGVLLYLVRFPFLAPVPRATTALVLVPALVWTGLDLVRTKLDPSGLWGPLFLTQEDTAAAGLAPLAGPWLLTFAIVVVNYGIALALIRGRPALRPATVALVPLLAAAGAASASAPAGTVTVAAVQPGYDTAEFDGQPLLRNFQRHDYEPAALDLIRDLAPLTQAAARRGAELVVWPEAVVWVHPTETPSTRFALQRLASETRVAIVVPFFLRGAAEGGTVTVLPDGRLTQPQAKQRPMWYLGERGGNRDGVHPAPAPGGPVGTMLGVDAQDAAVARRLVEAGARLLSSSTHDWEQLAPQQRAFARLSSAAVGAPIVRADWRYGSAVLDRGRLVAGAGDARRRTVVVARVSPADGRTLYARIGDSVGWALAAAGLTAALWLRLRLRRT